MALEDLPLLHGWINSDGIRQIWNQGAARSLDEITAKYGPRISGQVPTDPYLILLNGTPIGYIQTYLWRDHPSYAVHLKLTEEAASLDLFIGEERWRGRGLGPVVLNRFLKEGVFARPGVVSCVITPEEGNTAAIRAYEKAGFRHLRTVDIPGEPGPVHLMRIGREGVQAEGDPDNEQS
ncbi:MAG TPA: GNAT family N-acetyltransferase [Bacillota bacterium]|jgi:RimJ/RimL family protein N-acetyltransferase